MVIYYLAVDGQHSAFLLGLCLVGNILLSNVVHKAMRLLSQLILIFLFLTSFWNDKITRSRQMDSHNDPEKYSTECIFPKDFYVEIQLGMNVNQMMATQQRATDKRKMTWGGDCRDGSLVKSICFSCARPGSGPSNHLAIHNCLLLRFQRIDAPLWSPWAPACMWGTETHRDKYTYI